MDDKDRLIEELQAENRNLKEQFAKVVKHQDMLDRVHNPLVKAVGASQKSFAQLWDGYVALTEAASQCSVSINDHFTQYKNGTEFNAEFVRLQIKTLVEKLEFSTQKFRAASTAYQVALDELIALDEWDKKPTARSENES